MFIQFILNNIWKVYEKVQNRDEEDIKKFVKANNLQIDYNIFEKDNTKLAAYIMN